MVPGVAAAQSSMTLYVSTSSSASDLNGNNLCQDPSYPCATVDQAVYAAVYWGGAVTISIAPGTYDQQPVIAPGQAAYHEQPQATLGSPLSSLTIVGSGSGSSGTMFNLPTSPTQTVTSLFDHNPVVTGLAVVSSPVPVTIQGVAVDGSSAANAINGCNNVGLSGILYQNSSGTVDNVKVANWSPSNPGCGVGQGVTVISGPGGTSNVTVANSTVADYGKSGILAVGTGSAVTVTGNTVTEQPSGNVATNGIEVDFGATGTISNNQVSGNDFTGTPNTTDPQADYASGMLFYGAGGVTVTGNTLQDNQIGIQSVATDATIGGSSSAQGNTISESGTGIPNSIGIYVVPCDTYCQSVKVPTGGTYQVSIQNNSVQGIPWTYTSDSPTVVSAGIWVGNAASTGASGSLVATVVNNAVHGGFLGIVAGNNSSGEQINVSGNQVSGYQKSGIGIGSPQRQGDNIHATVTGNTVTGPGPRNVDDWAANGIEMLYGASGTIANNHVAGDIYTGTQPTESTGIIVFESSNVSVINNVVSDSQVGIAVQTAGYAADPNDFAMAGDTVQGNTIQYDSGYQAPGVVSGETDGTWGVWVASYCSSCSVQATVSGNVLNGANSTNGNVPSAGVELGDVGGQGGAAGGVQATVVGNSITGWTQGVLVAGTTAGQLLARVNDNDLSNNAIDGVANVSGNASGTNQTLVDATDNWWGNAGGPQNGGSSVTGSVNFSPWLASVAVSGPASVVSGTSSTFNATLEDNNGQAVALDSPLQLAFATSPTGECSPAEGTTSFTGSVSFTCTPGPSGNLTVDATVLFGGASSSLSGSQAFSVQAPASPPPPPPVPTTIYVSPSGSDTTGTGTASSPFATIAHALQVAAPGATIVVEPGHYYLTAPLNVVQAVYLESDAANGGSASNTVVDATGQLNGVVIAGPTTAGSVIRGLTIQGAEKAGLVAMNTSRLTIADNVLQQNDQSYAASNPNLPPGPNGFTATNAAGCSPQDDCEALHLIGVSNSIVTGNTVTQNLDGGIYLTDETGPTYGNQITDNTVTNNAVDCGITLASHSGLGVYDNTVAGNTSSGNGGAGILMATPIPTGAVYGNTIVNNVVTDNFQGGIVLHTHASEPNVPDTVYDDVITQNQIAGNQADPFAQTMHSVGISIVGGGTTISDIQVTQNSISNEYYGVYESNVSNVTVSGNNFTSSVTVDVYPPPPPASQGITRTLQPGWNTLSLPFVPDSATMQELTGLLQGPSPVLYWDPATNSWQGVGNLPMSQQQSLLQTPMQGFYVEVPASSGSVQLTLTPNTSIQPGPPPSLPLQSGWNLVGPSATQGSQSSGDFLAGLPASSIPIIVDPNGTPQSVVNPLQSGSGTLTVQDGFAYWVYGTNLPSGSALAGGIPTGSVNGGS